MAEPKTGWPAIEALMTSGGFKRGELCVFAAHPRTEKETPLFNKKLLQPLNKPRVPEIENKLLANDLADIMALPEKDFEAFRYLINL
jgi:hypothetical protein